MATCMWMLHMQVFSKKSNFGEYSHLPKWLFLRFSVTRQTRQAFLGYLPNLHLPKMAYHATCQTFGSFGRCFDYVESGRFYINYNLSHLPRAVFEKNVTHLTKFVRVMSESGKWCMSGHCLVQTQSCLTNALLQTK